MNLTVRTPLNTQLGYGHAGWEIVKSLKRQEHGICLFPLGSSIHMSQEDQILLQEIHSGSINYLDHQNPCLLIWHEFQLIQQFTGKGDYIAFPFFEINQLDQVRIINLNYADKICVASQWAKQVLENNAIQSPITVVPLGVDTNIFYPTTRQEGPYKFFTVGKIEKRKCTELLADIFSAAFDINDEVELHVLCDSPLPQIKQQMSTIKERYKNSRLGDKVFIHGNKPFDRDLAEFIQSMDCGLFLTRAEGFGLPILQSLACGKQVITTDYSAQTEFVNSNNSHLVNITELETAADGIWFNGLGTWAKIGNKEIEQCITYMRKCYKDRQNNINGIETSKQFTWEKTVECLINSV